MTAVKPIGVGLLGASRICWQTWTAIHANGLRVTHVGCRDAARGSTFVNDICTALNISEADRPHVVSYSDLIAAKEVDVVYISIPVALRDPWVQECVKHGKHVVGEKPPAVDAEVLRGWIEALSKKNLMYMDGTMLSHGQRIKDVCTTVKEELGGHIKHISANFSINFGPEFFASDIRMNPSLEPHGALGDLGWYCIRYILHLMNFEMPSEVTGRVLKEAENGAIISFAGDMIFKSSDDVVTFTSIYCSFETAMEQTVYLGTPTGTLQIKDFVHPVTVRTGAGSDIDPAVGAIFTEVYNGSYDDVCISHNTRKDVVHCVAGETANVQRDALWRDVATLLHRKDSADPLVVEEEGSRYWATIAWKTQAVMDKMLESARQSRSGTA